MIVDEQSAWPGPDPDGPRPSGRGIDPWRPVLAAYLADVRPAPLDHPDAWLSTHTGVRSQRNKPSDQAAAVVHRIDIVLPARPFEGMDGVYITGCGLAVRICESERTARTVTCGRLGCPTVPQRHERPAPVVTPVGPCHGGARQTSTRTDRTGNTVAVRTGRDPLQLVKSTAVNRARDRQPRSHVATAGVSAQGTTAPVRPDRGTGKAASPSLTHTTSPARAGRPSEGEPRVLESAAPDRQGRPMIPPRRGVMT